MLIKKQIWIFVVFLYINLSANTINIPLNYSTIQDGINAAITGDTVLVQPGIYIENISFIGKNIIVGSLFLTTSDTSYISQTIIDGNQTYSVVRFENMENYNAVLSGFTLRNGLNTLGGGGIFCFAFSSPTLENLVIKENTGAGGGGILCFGYANPMLNNLVIKNNEAVLYGGGIHCEFLSNPTLNNVLISDNISYQDGGGLYFLDSSSAIINNSIIKNNYAERNGGGIGCENGSDINATNIQLLDNSAQIRGGGIYLKNANPAINQSMIQSNKANQGGGMYSYLCQNPVLINSIIEGNRSYFSGGGIELLASDFYLENVTIRKNIANNYGGGIHCDSSNINFSVINRCNLYLNFAGQTGNDLYNNGTDAVNVILDTFTVKDMPANYQVYPSEFFSFDIQNDKVQRTSANLYIDPNGNDKNDGLSPDSPLKTLSVALTKSMPDNQYPQTIFAGSGIYSSSSTDEIFPINMKDFINIIGNSGNAAIFDAENQSSVFIFDRDRSVKLNNVALTGGSAEKGGAVFCQNSDPFFERVTLFDNAAEYGGGIYCDDNSTPFIFNSTVAGNNTINGGGIYINNDHAILVNSIFWNNFPEEIFINNSTDSGMITVAYSNIKGGQDNIIAKSINSIYWLNGNMDFDPLFINSSGCNYNLQDTSVCINSGVQDSLIRYDNGNKILVIPSVSFSGKAPDLGAWEYIEVINGRPIIDTNNPVEFVLFQNYPNPFNPKTRIDFQLPETADVTISVYNSRGQLIETLLKSRIPAGKNSVLFDGNNYASDQYFYRIHSNKYNAIKKMLLIK